MRCKFAVEGIFRQTFAAYSGTSVLLQAATSASWLQAITSTHSHQIHTLTGFHVLLCTEYKQTLITPTRALKGDFSLPLFCSLLSQKPRILLSSLFGPTLQGILTLFHIWVERQHADRGDMSPSDCRSKAYNGKIFRQQSLCIFPKSTMSDKGCLQTGETYYTKDIEQIFRSLQWWRRLPYALDMATKACILCPRQ